MDDRTAKAVTTVGKFIADMRELGYTDFALLIGETRKSPAMMEVNTLVIQEAGRMAAGRMVNQMFEENPGLAKSALAAKLESVALGLEKTRSTTDVRPADVQAKRILDDIINRTQAGGQG